MLSLYLSMLENERERKRMAEVYEAYQFTCLFVARRIVNDNALAEDVVHNTFISLIRNKKFLELPDDKLRALLIVIAKRRSIDLLRKRDQDKTESLDDMESIPSPEEPVELQVLTAEDFERLTKCINALDEPYKSIMQMKHFFDLSNTEIGNFLDMTKRQVETGQYRAKLKIRHSFGEEMKNNA